LWIHHFRLSEGERETFKHAIIIEEAHHILLRKKQEMTGTEAVTDIILREIRPKKNCWIKDLSRSGRFPR
jgi:3-dehydroquinate synthetase